MTVTTVKSQKAYQTLCRVLERNEILYECDEKNMCIKCSVSGRDRDMNIYFVIEPPKMLLTVYVPIDVGESWKNVSDLALALCVINDTLSDGHFGFDRRNMEVYFKITSSFYDTWLNDSVCEYMLSAAAENADEYCTKINALGMSFMS